MAPLLEQMTPRLPVVPNLVPLGRQMGSRRRTPVPRAQGLPERDPPTQLSEQYWPLP